MASNSDIVSMIKLLLNILNDTKKDSTANNQEQEAMESTSSDEKPLEQGERLSPPALEVAFLGLSPAAKDYMKHLNDILSNKISQLEERIITLEDVKGRRFTAIESECGTSQEIKLVPDRISSLEENICTLEEKKAIADKLSSLEDKIGKLEKTREIPVRQSSLENNTSTSEETKAIVERLSSLEKNMSTLEEVKSTVEKLEEKLTSLSETKGFERNLTGTEEEFISKEASQPQHFDSLYKGRNVLLTNNYLTAERIEPNDYEWYGGVISKFPLKEEEVFNIIIEETIDKYGTYGAIALGVISDKKAEVEGVESIFYSIKGTWAIKSDNNSPKGKSHVYKDNDIINEDAYPLDTRNLPVGTVLGIKLRRNGDVHFYLNGLDKGVAFRNVPNNVFAFVDVIFDVTKIRIM